MRILRILFLEFVEFSGNKLRIWLRIFVTFYTTDPWALFYDKIGYVCTIINEFSYRRDLRPCWGKAIWLMTSHPCTACCWRRREQSWGCTAARRGRRGWGGCRVCRCCRCHWWTWGWWWAGCRRGSPCRWCRWSWPSAGRVPRAGFSCGRCVSGKLDLSWCHLSLLESD